MSKLFYYLRWKRLENYHRLTQMQIVPNILRRAAYLFNEFLTQTHSLLLRVSRNVRKTIKPTPINKSDKNQDYHNLDQMVSNNR